MIPIWGSTWRGSPVWAFSVRPDLWPPGEDLSWLTPGTLNDYVHLSWWEWHQAGLEAKARASESRGVHLPGVAEATVLAGGGLVHNVSNIGGPGAEIGWSLC